MAINTNIGKQILLGLCVATAILFPLGIFLRKQEENKVAKNKIEFRITHYMLGNVMKTYKTKEIELSESAERVDFTDAESGRDVTLYGTMSIEKYTE